MGLPGGGFMGGMWRVCGNKLNGQTNSTALLPSPACGRPDRGEGPGERAGADPVSAKSKSPSPALRAPSPVNGRGDKFAIGKTNSTALLPSPACGRPERGEESAASVTADHYAYSPRMYCSKWLIKLSCSEMMSFTKSPIDSRPINLPSSITGKCRRWPSVISCMQ